jgi:hypothetical protein
MNDFHLVPKATVRKALALCISGAELQ